MDSAADSPKPAKEKGLALGPQGQALNPTRAWPLKPSPGELTGFLFLPSGGGGWTLLDEINYRYGFQEDFSEFNERFKDDPQLGPIIKKWPGMRVMSLQSLYEYLVIGIILQNCTVKRSVNMMQVLFENYGTRVHFDG